MTKRNLKERKGWRTDDNDDDEFDSLHPFVILAVVLQIFLLTSLFIFLQELNKQSFAEAVGST